jgi:hypothetical protein
MFFFLTSISGHIAKESIILHIVFTGVILGIVWEEKRRFEEVPGCSA